MSTAEKVVKKSMADTMDPAEKARADAIMHAWLEFNASAKSIEDAFNAQAEDIGAEVGRLIQKKLGLDGNPSEGREGEFGRLLGDTIRTFGMRLPYWHQANDALIKEQLKTFDFALQHDCMEQIVEHDVASMYEILHERVYWIEQTGDISLALDAVTTPTCFRNLTVGEGFQWHGPEKVSWVSPYKRVLEKGWLRNIWTDVTEQKIHDLWTKPRFEGYARHLECRFDISEWDEDSRMISIEVSPLD